MSDTTFEEAKRCPKCKTPGVDQGRRSAPTGRGSTIHTIMCTNNKCKWYNTTWIVQLDGKGKVCEAKGPRVTMPTLPGTDATADYVLEALQKQVEAEQRPGTEVQR